MTFTKWSRIFVGPNFAQLLFSTDTLQFARDALFQHLYRPTVGLVNQWTNHCKAVLMSWEGFTVSMKWIIDNKAILAGYTWNHKIASKYIKYIKSHDTASQDIATVLHLLCHQLDQSKGSLPIRRKASLDGLKCLPLNSNQLVRENAPYCKLSRKVWLPKDQSYAGSHLPSWKGKGECGSNWASSSSNNNGHLVMPDFCPCHALVSCTTWLEGFFHGRHMASPYIAGA